MLGFPGAVRVALPARDWRAVRDAAAQRGLVRGCRAAGRPPSDLRCVRSLKPACCFVPSFSATRECLYRQCAEFGKHFCCRVQLARQYPQPQSVDQVVAAALSSGSAPAAAVSGKEQPHMNGVSAPSSAAERKAGAAPASSDSAASAHGAASHYDSAAAAAFVFALGTSQQQQPFAVVAPPQLPTRQGPAASASASAAAAAAGVRGSASAPAASAARGAADPSTALSVQVLPLLQLPFG